jgi:hypothetical protein
MEKVVVENMQHLNQDILVVEQLLLKVLLVFMVKKKNHFQIQDDIIMFLL